VGGLLLLLLLLLTIIASPSSSIIPNDTKGTQTLPLWPAALPSRRL